MKKNKIVRPLSGFGLIELLVTMGIVAALLTLGVTAYRIVQEKGRDSSRSNVLADVSTAVNAYKLETLTYPNDSDVNFNSDGFYINLQKKVNFKAHQVPGLETTQNSTKYYYSKASGGYILCALLESGSIRSLGTIQCPDTLP